MLLHLVLALQLVLGPALQRLVSRFIKAVFVQGKPSRSVLVGLVLLVAAVVVTTVAGIKVLVVLVVPAAAFNSAAVHTQPHLAVAAPCRLNLRLFRLLPTHVAQPMLLSAVMIRPVTVRVSAKVS